DLEVEAAHPDERDPAVRFDRREWVVRDLRGGERRGGEEGGFADVRLPDDPELHGASNGARAQVRSHASAVATPSYGLCQLSRHRLICSDPIPGTSHRRLGE